MSDAWKGPTRQQVPVATIGAVGQSFTVYEKNWECTDCHAENYATRERCYRCRHRKPAGGGGLVADPALAAAMDPSGQTTVKWQEIYDPVSRHVYYHNKETGETQWSRPEEMGPAPHNSGWFGRGSSHKYAQPLQHYLERNERWLKRPAKKQQEHMENTMSVKEGAMEYNIWYHKFEGDHWTGGRGKEAAETRCFVEDDAGATKADRIDSKSKYFCVYFAHGACARGAECSYFHRTPLPTDDAVLDQFKDCFGRERHRDQRDDMGGVGSFNDPCRTLYIGGISKTKYASPDALEAALWRRFGEWGEVENLNVIHPKSIAFVRYRLRANAEFAREAMANQPVDHKEVLNLRWAYEDKNPVAKEAAAQSDQDAVLAILQARGANVMLPPPPPSPPPDGWEENNGEIMSEAAAYVQAQLQLAMVEGLPHPQGYVMPAATPLPNAASGEGLVPYPNTDAQYPAGAAAASASGGGSSNTADAAAGGAGGGGGSSGAAAGAAAASSAANDNAGEDKGEWVWQEGPGPEGGQWNWVVKGYEDAGGAWEWVDGRAVWRDAPGAAATADAADAANGNGEAPAAAEELAADDAELVEEAAALEMEAVAAANAADRMETGAAADDAELPNAAAEVVRRPEPAVAAGDAAVEGGAGTDTGKVASKAFKTAKAINAAEARAEKARRNAAKRATQKPANGAEVAGNAMEVSEPERVPEKPGAPEKAAAAENTEEGAKEEAAAPALKRAASSSVDASDAGGGGEGEENKTKRQRKKRGGMKITAAALMDPEAAAARAAALAAATNTPAEDTAAAAAANPNPWAAAGGYGYYPGYYGQPQAHGYYPGYYGYHQDPAAAAAWAQHHQHAAAAAAAAGGAVWNGTAWVGAAYAGQNGQEPPSPAAAAPAATKTAEGAAATPTGEGNADGADGNEAVTAAAAAEGSAAAASATAAGGEPAAAAANGEGESAWGSGSQSIHNVCAEVVASATSQAEGQQYNQQQQQQQMHNQHPYGAMGYPPGAYGGWHGGVWVNAPFAAPPPAAAATAGSVASGGPPPLPVLPPPPPAVVAANKAPETNVGSPEEAAGAAAPLENGATDHEEGGSTAAENTASEGQEGTKEKVADENAAEQAAAPAAATEAAADAAAPAAAAEVPPDGGDAAATTPAAAATTPGSEAAATMDGSANATGSGAAAETPVAATGAAAVWQYPQQGVGMWGAPGWPQQPWQPLPPPWQAVTDPASGGVYYYNPATGVTTWTLPTAAG